VSSDGVTTVRPKARPETDDETRLLPPYHVILENDDHHTFEFVISVLQKVFRVTEQQATVFAMEAHTKGRAIVWTGAKEVAELRVEQMLGFSETLQSGRKLGPLGVYLEPAA
jgi:ATP-dependent Clp protease adaptor protein ClpS